MDREDSAEAPTAGALALPQRRALAPTRPPRSLVTGFRDRLREGSQGIAPLGIPHLRHAAVTRRPLHG
eukprot:4338558-Alexandrium_andersonii.AAC.1